MEYQTKTGDKAEVFAATGARRDARKGKGRYDLLPLDMLRRDAALYERGAVHYGDRNWEKGMPLGRVLDSAMRHLVQLLAGDRDEDHAAAVRFNVAAYEYVRAKVTTGELPSELDDLGHTTTGREAAKEALGRAREVPGVKSNTTMRPEAGPDDDLYLPLNEIKGLVADWMANREIARRVQKATGELAVPYRLLRGTLPDWVANRSRALDLAAERASPKAALTAAEAQEEPAPGVYAEQEQPPVAKPGVSDGLVAALLQPDRFRGLTVGKAADELVRVGKVTWMAVHDIASELGTTWIFLRDVLKARGFQPRSFYLNAELRHGLVWEGPK
jgi:hypothetical protein